MAKALFSLSFFFSWNFFLEINQWKKYTSPAASIFAFIEPFDSALIFKHEIGFRLYDRIDCVFTFVRRQIKQ